jgi:tetratricopeptide (TPR) repeat protein
LGDLGKGLAYLRRALESHERYADQQARADTLLVTAELMLEGGDADAAHSFVSEASALLTLTGSVYDLVHERIVRSMLARAAGDYATAITLASEARRRAEAQGLISFHLYAKANEALARALAGEPNQGALLARMALAAVESAGGSEYGLEIRALSATAVELAAPDTASEAYQKAAAHIRSVLEHVRDPELRASFLERKLVAEVLRKVDDTPASLVGADVADSVASR